MSSPCRRCSSSVAAQWYRRRPGFQTVSRATADLRGAAVVDQGIHAGAGDGGIVGRVPVGAGEPVAGPTVPGQEVLAVGDAIVVK